MKKALTSKRHSERREESQATQLRKARRARLVRESAKLDPAFEQAMAEEGMSRELAEWPEY